MELLRKKKDLVTEGPIEEVAWLPEVLDGSALTDGTPADLDLAEVWYWLHARLKALGEMSHDDARLTALLNWNDVTVSDALRAARLHADREDAENTAHRAHLEFLTAEFLARQVLGEEAIPSPELRPA